MAGSGMVSLGVIRREEYGATIEVHMFVLNANELTDTAAELIDGLEHELVPVIVNAVKELGQFVDGEIPNDLAESFVLS